MQGRTVDVRYSCLYCRDQMITLYWKTGIYAAFAGFLLDCIFGDPHELPHPVRFMGKLISLLERILLHKKNRSFVKRLLGALLVIIMLAVTGGVSFGILALVYKLEKYYLGSQVITFAFMSVMSAQCLAARDLNDSAMAVCRPLLKGDIKKAREALSMIVGRDTEFLDENAIVRAAVETVAENTNDGVLAPAFYLLIAGPIGGMVYKVINTMDSMLGYKNEKYGYFGSAAARLDDIAGFIPARLSALFMVMASAILHYDSANAWRIFRRDRYKHESPNSAQCESVCAGALEIMLGGDSYYNGKLVKKPCLGDAMREAAPGDIIRACRLMYMTVVLFFLTTAAFLPFVLHIF